MQTDLAEKIVDDFQQGRLTRRQLVTRLMGLGAALATLDTNARAQQSEATGQGTATPAAAEATFRATGLDHIALDVADVPRSRDFYAKHLGLRVIRGDDRALFMGADRDFFLTLFRAEKPALNHYCYAIRNFNPDEAVQKLKDAGLRPRREGGGRVYFPDPDGLTVQVAGCGMFDDIRLPRKAQLQVHARERNRAA
jgi:catechol 2,3-dioxygenase-like lactoylglutathione lyase family enzyme